MVAACQPRETAVRFWKVSNCQSKDFELYPLCGWESLKVLEEGRGVSRTVKRLIWQEQVS